MCRQLTFDYELDQLCNNCWENPISIGNVCRSCYYKKRYLVKHPDATLHLTKNSNPPHNVTWYRARLIKKYGPEIMEDLNNLKTQHFWTLVEMGNKYGFSREYARQLFNKFFGENYGDYAIEKTAKREADRIMMECNNDPRHKVADYRPGYAKSGAEIELMVFNKCKEKGFNVEIPCDAVFDLKINNFQVDVKSTTKEMSASKVPGATTYFHFGLKPKQHDVCDFFICYARPLKTFYIIPKGAIKAKTGLYIKATASKLGAQYIRGPGKYAQYKEAWHLLET